MRERTILHADMDSYFASVEQQVNPSLRGKPIAVCGPGKRTVVAASSKEAKCFGVKSAMTIPQAKKLCPQLVLVLGDFEKYQKTSRKIFKILADYTPYLEISSIDEAFLEVTASQHLFGGAINIAKEIKKRIREEVGEFITCSIGISINKLMAKLASEKSKPNGFLVIEGKEIPKFLTRIKLSDFCGIGQKTVEHLKQMKINNTNQLAKVPEKVLTRAFGVYGKFLKDIALGLDDSPVIPFWPPKSTGRRLTLPFDVDDLEKIKPLLLRLAEQVGRKLRNEKMRGKVVTLTIRTADFKTFSKQRSLKRFINDGYEIYQEGLKILSSCFPKKKIRMIGVSVSGLVFNQMARPLLLEDRRREDLVLALDKINDRFGEFTIVRAPVLKTGNFKEDISDYGRISRFKI